MHEVCNAAIDALAEEAICVGRARRPTRIRIVSCHDDDQHPAAAACRARNGQSLAPPLVETAKCSAKDRICSKQMSVAYATVF